MNADGTEERNDKRDNLQKIKGIGPDYERALHQLGVLTFAQLAEFEDALQLQKALKKSGFEIDLWRIEKYGSWIDQARKKVPWKEHAAFIVSFDHYTDKDGKESWRTRVYKTENGDEIEFGGTDPSAWTKWIFEQSKLTIGETHIDEAVDAEKTDLLEAELVVAHVPAAKIGKQLKLVNVQVKRPSTAVPQRELFVQVNFELLGSEVETWTEEMPPYRLELYLQELESHATELVASTQKRLEPGILEYEIGEAILIPSPGRYELYALLFSLPPTEMMVTYQGPIINVVPHPVSAQ